MRILKNFCIACVRLYQLALAPLLISLGVQCRFSPSCSHYAIQAIKFHGVVRGLGLAICRLGRCHPFCSGGYDPVPLMVRKEIGRNG